MNARSNLLQLLHVNHASNFVLNLYLFADFGYLNPLTKQK